MYLKEILKKRYLKLQKHFASITIYGPRQVGKSTLIERLFPDVKYISLDDISVKDFALRDPKGFLKYYGTPLIIDEIQKAPALSQYIKIEIDEMKRKCLMNDEQISLLYILSGSNQFELQEAVTESLAGRTCIFNLSSLSYNEIKGRSSHSSFDPELDVLRSKETF